VFVDRDGTLIAEAGYLSDPDGVVLLPGVAHALRQLRDAGLPVVVISNQAGVGRGRYPLAAAHATMARLRVLLRGHGVELDAVRFCPHAPDAGCACRKPGTRLFAEAAEDLRLSLASSVMVGDKRLDAEAGQAAGGMGLLVRTGYGRQEEAKEGRAPDAVFDDFAAAAAWILERYERL
jgi:histidinol-phosphate phosphatase family protein